MRSLIPQRSSDYPSTYDFYGDLIVRVSISSTNSSPCQVVESPKFLSKIVACQVSLVCGFIIGRTWPIQTCVAKKWLAILVAESSQKLLGQAWLSIPSPWVHPTFPTTGPGLEMLPWSPWAIDLRRKWMALAVQQTWAPAWMVHSPLVIAFIIDNVGCWLV